MGDVSFLERKDDDLRPGFAYLYEGRGGFTARDAPGDDAMKVRQRDDDVARRRSAEEMPDRVGRRSSRNDAAQSVDHERFVPEQTENVEQLCVENELGRTLDDTTETQGRAELRFQETCCGYQI